MESKLAGRKDGRASCSVGGGMPESPVAGTNGRTHAGGGERLRTTADDVVDEPVDEEESEIDPACGGGLSQPVADRGNDPVFKTKLSTGGRPGLEARSAAEPDGARDGGGVLHGGFFGNAVEAANVGGARHPSGLTRVQDPELSSLRPRGWNQAVPLQSVKGSGTLAPAFRTALRPKAHVRFLKIKWGKSCAVTG